MKIKIINLNDIKIINKKYFFIQDRQMINKNIKRSKTD